MNRSPCAEASDRTLFMKDARGTAVVALAIAVVSCNRPNKTVNIELAVVDAGTLAVAAPDAAAPATAFVDLLYATNAVVAVSSVVDNPRDLPEHLIDRVEETAWNGKTGDLVGAWIAFRVPSDSHVDYVTMSSGFDKQGKTEDLFLANHRITKVRISRNGTLLKEADLSPTVRLPQRIDIAEAGGDFKIEVVAVQPGTHAGWKEITVSELAVFGTPGAHPRAKKGPPLVHVGSLDLHETAFDADTGVTYEAACAKFVSDDTAAAKESIATAGEGYAETYPDKASATCNPKGKLGPGHGDVLETAHITVKSAMRAPYFQQFSGEVLALRTAKGVTLTNVRIGGNDVLGVYGSTEYSLKSETWVDDKLVVRVEEHRISRGQDGQWAPGEDHETGSEARVVAKTLCDGVTCVTSDETKK